MDLTITIASYNSKDVTRTALRSIFEHSQDMSFEVIVVDNASTDGSADMIEHEFPFVRLIRSPKNLGFAAAHNWALQEAQGDFLLILNSDIEFLDNVAKNMIGTMQSWPDKVGALGPRIVNIDGTYVPSASHKQFSSKCLLSVALLNQFFPFTHFLPINFFRKKFGKKLKFLHGKFLDSIVPEQVEWVDGMCVLFRRETIQDTGLFDEQFFFDSEIGDLLVRVRNAGWIVLYAPQSSVLHLGGYSRKLNSAVILHSIRSYLTYYAKHRPHYVPYIRANLLTLLFIREVVSKSRHPSENDLRLWKQAREIVREFSVLSAMQNEAIPALRAQHIVSK